MIELYQYQKDAVNKLHNGSILCGGCGSGKSVVALSYYMKNHSDKDLYIITISKKRDSKEWEGEVSALGCPLPKAIDSWNNIRKYSEVKGAFFLFDEHKVSGHGKWSKRMISIAKSNNWILVTATPGDCWDDYATVFIANGYVKNKTAWNEDFCIWSRMTNFPKIIGYQREDILEKMRDSIMVIMEYKSEKIRVPHVVPYEIDNKEEDHILKARRSFRHPEMPPFRNISAMFAYMRMNLPIKETKIEKLIPIFEEHKRVIVFYNFVSEKFEIEDAAIKAGRPYHQCNGQIHDPVPTEEEWVYAVNYGSGAEAWNCSTCDTIVFYSMNYSYKTMEQAKGRIDRVNSPYKVLHYYEFIAPEYKIDQGILQALGRKEKFNEEALAKEEFIGYEEDFESKAFIQHVQTSREYDVGVRPY